MPETFDYRQRCRQVQQGAGEAGIDLVVISPSSDMTYLSGYVQRSSDRPTLLAIPAAGEPFVVVPALEAMKARAKTGGLFRIVPWAETENPFAILRREVPCRVARFAVAEQMWATDLLRLEQQFAGARVESAGPLVTALRIRKSARELDVIRRAARAADSAYEAIRRLRFGGLTETRLAEQVVQACREAGLAIEGCILASGPASASPHHVASERVIGPGDAVWIDYGGRIEDYPADVTRTVHVGQPDAEFRRVYDTVRRAQETAARAVRPGVPCEELDRLAREVIIEAGYGGGILHRTGHGLGLDGHEHPYIVAGNRAPLEPGMVFSVEPGIYLEGRFGVRIEDIVAVTEDGVEILNLSSHELFVVS